MIFKLDKQRRTTVAVSGILLLTGNILKYNGILGNSRIETFILMLIGSMFVIELCITIKKNSILEYLGKKSLPIYVLHGIAIAATRLFLTKLHLNTLYGIVPLIICTVFGVFLPVCTYWISLYWKLDGCFYPGRYIKA